MEHSAGDDACTEAGGGLDEQHVVETVPLPAPLRQHDDVRVVIEADRRLGQFAQIGRQRHAVPSVHAGRIEAASSIGVGRAGDAQTDTPNFGVLAAALVEQDLQAFGDVWHQFIGSDADLLINIGHGQHLAGQIADTELGSAPADRRGQHNAGLGVEDQARGWPASGGGGFGALEHQPRCLKRGHPGRYSGTGEARDPTDVGTGGNSSITNQTEHLAGGRPCLRRP